MAHFILTIEASTDLTAGTAPLLEVLVGGSVVSSAAITAQTGVGSDLLVFTLDFDDAVYDYPSSLVFRFNSGSGDGDETLTLENVYINGEAIDPAGDLTAQMLTQGQTSSLSSPASFDYLFGRADPALSDFGTTTDTGTGSADTLTGGSNADIIDGGGGDDRLRGVGDDDAIDGGAGNDTLFGEDGNDALLGGIGDDILHGNDGDDMLHGQDDNDTLFGEDGNDLLNGGNGDDYLVAGPGDDVLYGEAGNDHLIGQTGSNTMYGDDGDDVLVGGNGADLMYGGNDNDTLLGGLGNDTMYGGAGIDLLAGGNGDDILDGGDGNDTLRGQNGDDTLYGGVGNDRFDGGAGIDTVDYSHAAAAITASLAVSTASDDGDGGSDTLSGIENLTGSANNDTLTGNSSANVLTGGNGNDTLTGRGGADTLDGGNGTDTASYVNAINGVTADLSAGTASNDGNGSSDTLTSIENLTGSSHDDTLTGDGNNNVLTGNDGDDTIVGGGGVDMIDGNDGDDTLSGDAGNDVIQGGVGSDTLNGGADDDTLYALDNGISAADADQGYTNVLNGDAGDDTLYGSTGSDILNGGANDDTIYSAADTIAIIENLYGVTYNSGTGNFYQFMNGNVHYSVANAGASSSMVEGIAGHVVTITTAAENTFVDNLISDDVWIAASDSGTEGEWYWIEGPEAGTQFWTGGSGGSAVGGLYAGWNGAEPNSGTSDNYATIRTNGTWRDRDAQGGGQNSESYVIEWEGKDVFANTSFLNSLSGDDGTDTLYGNDGGTDYFAFNEATAFDGNIDLINNFNTADGDAIDLNLTLNGYYVYGIGVLTNYVQIVDNGGNSDVYVDITGSATFGAAQQIATLVGVTGLTDEDALAASNNLIVPLANFDILGTPAPDILNGTAGNNKIGALASDDFIYGGAGNDELWGFAGSDTADYAAAAGAVTASLATGGTGAGQDGDGGTDTYYSIENLAGSAFNDSLTGDGNNNVLTGNAGNDTLVGGGGTDTAAYTNAGSAVTASLASGTASGGDGNDTFASIENLTGSDYNDTLTGDGNDNVLKGGAGDDTMTGAGGNDTLYGGDDNDTLSGGSGNDTLNGGAGTDTVDYTGAAAGVTVDLTAGTASDDGDGGADTLVSIENIEGSAFDDNLSGDIEDNTINGNNGDDLLHGAAGNDILNGGTGSDTANYTNAASAVNANLITATASNDGDGGTDTFTSIENLTGSDYNDTLVGDNNANTIDGGSGTDTITGNDGDDTIYGGGGDDVITGDGGNDTIYAGNGASYISYVETTYSVTHYAGTGNFYQYVNSNVAYATADTAATGSLVEGEAGHLATITSDPENTFVAGIITNAIWLGGSDSAVEGDWRWVTGPEAGTLFWNGATVTYDNWAGGQPNDWGGGQDDMEMQTNGTWTDTTGSRRYVIEWEGSGILGGGGNTTINGGTGDDTIYGGDGDDILNGNADNDTISGGGGTDTIDGGTGTDTVDYSAAAAGVTVDLGTGVTADDGDGGTDTLTAIENVDGSAYDDDITGDGSANTLSGNNGDDVLYGAGGNDTLDGGAGTDTADYSSAAGDVTASLLAGTASNDGDGGSDTFVSIEVLIGGAGDDNLTGDNNDNVLTGNNGNDTLIGGAGNDTLAGGNGTDTADYSTAAAGITADLSAGTVSDDGDGGSDTLTSIENITGSGFDDTIIGDNNDNVIDGDGGTDTLSYEAATSAVTADLSTGTSSGGGGNDTISNIENLTGSDYNDTLTGDGNANVIDGGTGDDTINGGSGNDTIYGGGGNDTMNGDDGDDIIYASAAYTVADALAENPNANYDSTNGNFYEIVTTSTDWNSASTAAAASTINSVGGHLATITDAAENTFIENLLSGTDAWVGARDDVYSTNNEWYWVEGPEDGTQFWTGGTGGSAVGGMYENWSSGAEPNDDGGPSEAMRMQAADGTWADRAASTSYDYVIEWEGSDVLSGGGGGGGTTTIHGGNGDDTVYGGSGDDTIYGDDDNDTLYGAVGSDTLYGGDGDDILYALDNGVSASTADDAYINTVDGGNDNDTIYGSGGTDTLLGGAGDDIIYSGSTPAVTVGDVTSAYPSVDYNAATGNFYEYVTSTDTWTNADAAARASTIFGVAGHLAVSTSAAENSYLDTLSGTSNIWLGGTDDNTYSSEGNWVWAGGSASEDGVMFWQGLSGGSAQNGFWTNWNAGEPNEYGSGEDYLEMYDGGVWNDNGAPNQPALADAYVIEWEGADILGAGNISTINGGSGADQLYGGTGTDIFKFDDNSGDCFTNPDTIHDFDESDGDTIDISDILDTEVGIGVVNTGNLSQYVNVDSAAGVQIDSTGSGSFGAGTTVTTFAGATNVSDEATLLGNGQLII